VELEPAGQDDFGLVFQLNQKDYPPKGNINFLPKYKNWENKGIERFWPRTMPKEIWVLEGQNELFTRKPSLSPFVRSAFIDSPNQLVVLLTNPLTHNDLIKSQSQILYNDLTTLEASETTLIPANAESSNVLSVKFPQKIDLDNLPGKFNITGFEPGQLIIRGVLDSSEYMTEAKLGLEYSAEKSTFRTWAPGATEVLLNLYKDSQTSEKEVHHLTKKEKGLWEITIQKDLKAKYYTFQVDGPDAQYDKSIEILDPYSTSTTAHNGRSMIFIDDLKIADSPVFEFNEAIIYEVHIRDFSISHNSGIQNKGKYLGFTETGTTLPGTDISTGLDHLVELGVNTLQIMPVQDFEHENVGNNYFWGYMPVNFNAPDGWFASDPTNGSAVVEFKKLVDACHKKGLKVIMDVVYNHTAEGNPNIRYNFNGFVPNFYYRKKLDNSYWNGSGCGNEVRSENPRVRKFILESLKYWVTEYKIDGFRFDLMGLHDHKTMEEIVSQLRAIKHDIFIYGEPWTAGDTPIQPTLKGDQRGKGFAVFNDHFRDALKGPWNNLEPGYVQASLNVERVKTGILGSIDDFADNPTEVINYVACHDGRTLWDRIVATTEDSNFYNDTILKAMDKLAAGILLTSQGTPFLHAGQEMLRTKFGSHNSYNQPDKINQIRWDYKQENMDIYHYYQGLIKLRNEHPLFRMKDASTIRKHLKFLDQLGFEVPDGCIAYKLKRSGSDSEKWREVLVLINPHHHASKFNIPENKWILVVNKDRAGTDIIEPVSATTIELAPVSMKVLYRP
jgi:pullulanase